MLERLAQTSISTYRYHADIDGEDRLRLGFIAEQLPALVRSKDGKGVDVYALVAYSIGAIKAQQRELAQQRTQIEVLTNKMRQLETVCR